MAKVCVVIPCYNQGEYVMDAIDSVLEQSFTDFEIIIVNDGSTDYATNEILQKLDIPKVKVIHTENCGLASARNTGITATNAEYILPLDADDKIGKRYLEEAVAILDRNREVGIVYCDAEYFGERSGRWDVPNFSEQSMLFHNAIFCSAVFRKSDWFRVGGYNSNMKYGHEDHDFWLSLIEIGAKVRKIDQTLFYYRVKESSMIKSLGIKHEQMIRQLVINHHELYSSNIEYLVSEYFRMCEKVAGYEAMLRRQMSVYSFFKNIYLKAIRVFKNV